jgi:hypothetical protein
MNKTDHHLTLPSDASLALYPKNSAAVWTTKLQTPLALHGRWEIGLIELTYPNSAYNVPEDQMIEFYQIINTAGDKRLTKIRVPAGIYEAADLIACINGGAPKVALAADDSKTVYSDYAFKATMSNSERKARFAFKHLRCFLVFPESSLHLRRILGFTNNLIKPIDDQDYLKQFIEWVKLKEPLNLENLDKYIDSQLMEIKFLKKNGYTLKNFPTEVVAEKCINTVYGNQTLFVYCDAADFSVVGDSVSQLLRTVPIKANSAFQMVLERFDPPYYVPVIRNYLESITVSLESDLGENARFQIGKSAIVVHLRKNGS